MQRKKIYSLFILVCLIFGSTFLAISIGLQAGASPLFYAAIRFTAAGTIMLIALKMFRRINLTDIKSLLFKSIILSLFMTVGTFGCMFIAQTSVDSGFMARLDSTGPLVTALFASLFLGKKLSLYHFIAFVLGMAGSFLIASPAIEAEPLYFAIAAGSVVLYAAGNAIYPLLFSKEDDTVLISALQSLIGGIILMIFALSFEAVSFTFGAVFPLIYLIIGGSVIGHTATLVLVREAGPVFASAWLFVAPAVATVLGFFILNEAVSISSITGTVLTLSGVFILDKAEHLYRKTADTLN